MVITAATAVDTLGALARRALRDEARLTPKPGLVDGRGSGAHTDLDLPTMLASADALEPWFAAMARSAVAIEDPLRLRRRLGELGRDAEVASLAVTGGANAHRGAIYVLGLLVAAAATAERDPAAIARAAGALARIPDPGRPPRDDSHGRRVRRTVPDAGAPVEAARGFPAVVAVGLPALHAARAAGHDEGGARLQALLAVMAVLQDSCVLHRGDAVSAARLRALAAAAHRAGGRATDEGRRRYAYLDAWCRVRRLSPGGAADVLAAVLLLDGWCDA